MDQNEPENNPTSTLSEGERVLDALARLLARQAAREWLDQLTRDPPTPPGRDQDDTLPQ